MKHAPTLAAIDAVELKMEESRRRTREGLGRVEAAFRQTVARPSTIAAAVGIAGVAGLAGFLLSSRRPSVPRRRTVYATGAGVAVASSVAAIARLLLSRYGVKGLTLVVRQFRKTWSRRAARNNANAGAVAPQYPATGPH
jgi:bacteriorhodopsin